MEKFLYIRQLLETYITSIIYIFEVYNKWKVTLLAFSFITFCCLSLTLMVYAEPISPPVVNVIAIQKEIFRVGIALFGVDNQTRNVFSLVKVDNQTVSRLLNPARDDMSDHDGVVESIFSFTNRTVPIGTPFTACILVVDTANYTCAKGYNSPSPTRTEFAQFSLK